ncbi:MAG: hypothetical protein KJ950_13175 [Proteobacteria bacterium]|nr:hypothetical protein [Pseudomonadota bacterium]MBU1686174.1 hypothetical protein [Pseudomonadota bacterium]
MTLRRISAAFILLMLLVFPFFNWRLGMVIWLCAWIMFLVAKIFDRREWKGIPPEDSDTE